MCSEGMRHSEKSSGLVMTEQAETNELCLHSSNKDTMVCPQGLNCTNMKIGGV